MGLKYAVDVMGVTGVSKEWVSAWESVTPLLEGCVLCTVWLVISHTQGKALLHLEATGYSLNPLPTGL